MKNQIVKKLFKKLLPLIFLISSVFFHLCYSFVYANFNFANWDSGDESIMDIFSVLWTFLFIFYLYLIFIRILLRGVIKIAEANTSKDGAEILDGNSRAS